ncbi:hypothetical protein PPTG_20201 [Phytophthora nicotianae INRA-310]|uniref:SET domain-containing protein n=1 Tax=Phytophthora nicotianae (strain INRA-310) TaxID=761204 RepID=W2PC40_PHYN3|nr:hypothetical protein PPTG_20201 [Phytophthora nicotianae INRA-310]ETM97574.1 hypothetical protein PPTG_20201 [Phytophthora nicotianae INRA-310]
MEHMIATQHRLPPRDEAVSWDVNAPHPVAINAECMGGLMTFVNYSCKSKDEFVEVVNGQRTMVVVMITKEIPRGREVTADYGVDLWFVCRCQRDGCRTVTVKINKICKKSTARWIPHWLEGARVNVLKLFNCSSSSKPKACDEESLKASLGANRAGSCRARSSASLVLLWPKPISRRSGVHLNWIQSQVTGCVFTSTSGSDMREIEILAVE